MSSDTAANAVEVRPGLRVGSELESFVRDELAPAAGIDDLETFWAGVERILRDLAPRNRELLKTRSELQRLIGSWHEEHAGQPHDADQYEAFLREIGYLEDEGDDFEVKVTNVDPEIATLSGPQLVVPVSNARYALNAANARWVSLYDALYGTNVLPEGAGTEKGTSYNPGRGEIVVEYAEKFLDGVAPLASGSYTEVTSWEVTPAPHTLVATFADGSTTQLADPAQFAGFCHKEDGSLASVLLRNHGLHLEITIDPTHPVGSAHRAGVCDLLVESAVTTIQDCEDSVAAVDAEDKAHVYRNWLGLMTGQLEDTFFKGGERMTRVLRSDREYTGSNGEALVLPGRSLLLVRNVGHLMTNDAVTLDGEEVPEGMLDAIFTSAAAKVDLEGRGRHRNSRAGSVYIVKPKMHGSAEVELTVDLFAAVEDLLGLERNTLKVGIMDEERRTTLNLRQCIRAARERVIFINTGFLDRTGDEMHTSMAAGPMVPKGEMKTSKWLNAYEDANVYWGIQTGLSATGQIGKGMWAMPDEMAAMVEQKIGHLQAGANCAWVPSPTAAALHALHYHQFDVAERQCHLATRPAPPLGDLLTIPTMAADRELSDEEVQRELDNNAQGILGYVVRWVDHGVGCSKVPDIHDVGLMEDRATCRISSQHIANWLHHGVLDRERVEEAFVRMAVKVDEQNAGDKAYVPMSDDPENNIAFRAALALAVEGTEQPSGYTEPILHRARRELKRQRG